MKYVIGLMSGTSVDGIDVALVKIKEEDGLQVEVLDFLTSPYTRDVREAILTCCHKEKSRVDSICYLNFQLAYLSVEAVEALLKKRGFAMEEIDLLVSHGHTLYHEVRDSKKRSTLQIGAGSILAQRTGITTVSNLRVRDMAVGGEGAPLVSYVDYLLFRSSLYSRVLQNIGGIANYTYLPLKCKLEDIEGTDTGPGNMLIDGVISLLTSGEKTYDDQGEWASRGIVSSTLLSYLLKHPFIEQDSPKTTGREEFGDLYLEEVLKKGEELGLNKYDLIATITAFTAYSIIDAYQRFIKGDIHQVIVGGGGSKNPVLLKMMREYSQTILGEELTILTLEDMGYSSKAKEAMAFALLGYLTMKGRRGNVPQVTGAKRPVILGDISPGEDFYQYLAW